MTNRVLHLMNWDVKFVPKFIEFLNKEFPQEEHLYIIYGNLNDVDKPKGKNVIIHRNLLKSASEILPVIKSARKIILHGLFSSHILSLLLLNPKILKKCYWAIWGGDLYIHNTQNKNLRWWVLEVIRKLVISRIGYFITDNKGDYELARKWYGAKGDWIKCFMYPSNLYKPVSFESEPHVGIHILLGNSADPSNNHIEVLDNLKHYVHEEIKIYCPLSYGNKCYAKQVADYGELHFGRKFIPMRELLPLEQYTKFLSKIDVAIFNHKRQQAFGNIVTLLGLGKKIFIRKEVTTWGFLSDEGILVYDTAELLNELTTPHCGNKNIEKIKSLFSEENLKNNLREIFH